MSKLLCRRFAGSVFSIVSLTIRWQKTCRSLSLELNPCWPVETIDCQDRPIHSDRCIACSGAWKQNFATFTRQIKPRRIANSGGSNSWPMQFGTNSLPGRQSFYTNVRPILPFLLLISEVGNPSAGIQYDLIQKVGLILLSQELIENHAATTYNPTIAGYMAISKRICR